MADCNFRWLHNSEPNLCARFLSSVEISGWAIQVSERIVTFALWHNSCNQLFPKDESKPTHDFPDTINGYPYK